MALIVQKFGGSSLANIVRIKKVAQTIAQQKKLGDQIVVVVSAMGDETDQLLNLAYEISKTPTKRELDMLLTAGERKSQALLSIALQELGCPATSFTGSQIGIITDENHTDARIMRIKGFRLQEALNCDKIPIVAGFQGVSIKREITTLGRGGSDTSAVALAVRLGADCCELYKDVPGIFTEDPKEFPGVKRVPEITYEEMSELATAGSKVLHPRACALAAKYNLRLVIKPAPHLTQKKPEGTIVKPPKSDNITTKEHRLLCPMPRRTKNLEKPVVRAITHSRNLNRFTLLAVPQTKGLAQAVSQLAQAKIPFVFFAHGVPIQHHFDLSFIIPAQAQRKAKAIFAKIKTKLKAKGLLIQKNLGSVSLVGAGIGSDSEIIAVLFKTLQKIGVHIDAFSTAESKITCYFHQKHLKVAIQNLLDRFHLYEKPRKTK
uniref:Aspartokinase n=1 Tax=candidate division WOR-3 bacterium TaxID=2052148 RepID=A0A7C6A905_UNCW3